MMKKFFNKKKNSPFTQRQVPHQDKQPVPKRPHQTRKQQPHVGDWRLSENATYDSYDHIVHLTEAIEHQKGAAIYQRVFNWKEVMIEFDYYMYGGRADGLSFFVADADRWDGKTLGPGGEALGYSSCYNVHNSGPGLAYGYFAIGFDCYGSFSKSDGNCIALRGPGYSYQGYDILERKSFEVSGSAWRSVRITLSMYKKKTVSVEVSCDHGETFEKVFQNVEVPEPAWGAPNIYMMGFVASTGLYKNKHYVKNMIVSSRSLSGIQRTEFASDVSIVSVN
jgi:hypothetical protein